MRRHQLDALTAREREVLDLIRRGLTNEEIAQRLGITLDGAKYHVSQILSKLGVATREEAAAVASGKRGRWWARWPVWAKIAGTAAVAAAVAGLAVLAWGVLRTGENDQGEAIPDLALEDLYASVEQAVTRPGFVIHFTVHSQRQDEDGVEAEFRQELWLDAVNDRARYDVRRVGIESGVEGASIVAILEGSSSYAADRSGVVQRSEAEANDFCPGTTTLFFSILFGCATDEASSPEARQEVRVDRDAEYQGRRATAFVIEESFTTEYYRGSQALPTLENAPAKSETRNTTQVYFAIDTFLPIARLHDRLNTNLLDDGRVRNEFHDTSVSTYEHEFIPVNDLPADFFEPDSIGHTGESSPTP